MTTAPLTPNERVGGEEPIRVDVRLIAATLRSLEDMVRDGAFRLDLYHRLRVVEIVVPPLRDRPEDIAPLVASVLTRESLRLGIPMPQVTNETMAKLRAHSWPGNVRELENVLIAGLLLSRGRKLSVPSLERAEQKTVSPADQSEIATMDEAMRCVAYVRASSSAAIESPAS